MEPFVNESLARTLIALGGLFLIGLVADLVGRRTAIPRVTLLLLCGFAAGPSGFAIFADGSARWFPTVANMALVMVGFLLGGSLTAKAFREQGRLVLGLSAAVALTTFAVLLLGLLLLGVRVELALLLAAISSSTAPAATVDVVRESDAEGPFSRTLLDVVAIDDAWGLILFSLALATAEAISGQGSGGEVLLRGAWELSGALLLGLGLGLPMALLTGRIEPGEPTLAEALGVVFLCGGLALWLGVSSLLASMTLGAVVANLARHHRRPFRAIEGIEWPFMILFFILAGATLELPTLAGAVALFAAYAALRCAGRMLGAWIGATLCRADPLLRRWIGPALLPQAGVALGMALVASQRLPELRDSLLPVVVAATVLFELLGPILARRALVAVGEAR